MKFELDPTPRRVVMIALLLFIEALVGGILALYNANPAMEFPDIGQMMPVIMTSIAVFASYLLGFMKRD